MTPFTPDAGEPAARPYHPPQKLLVRCPGCGGMVLRGLFVQGRIKKLPTPITPVLGTAHDCEASHDPR